LARPRLRRRLRHPLFATPSSPATGTALRPDLLDLYRLRWDVTEVAVCLARFREHHGSTADDQESWAILEDLVTRMAG
jgi:hypothetical protein